MAYKGSREGPPRRSKREGVAFQNRGVRGEGSSETHGTARSVVAGRGVNTRRSAPGRRSIGGVAGWWSCSPLGGAGALWALDVGGLGVMETSRRRFYRG